jgi:hypothetical protein
LTGRRAVEKVGIVRAYRGTVRRHREEISIMAKKSRGGRMTAAKRRAAKAPGGRGLVKKRKAGRKIMKT